MRSRRVRIPLLLGAFSLLAASCWKPEVAPTYTVTVTSDIVYGQGEVDHGGTFEDLLLDLYIPDVAGQDRFPLVVVMHGGSFMSNNKTQPRVVRWAEEFAARGYIVASIDYRLTGDDPVPSARVQPIYDDVGGAAGDPQAVAAVAAMDDILTALDFLHARPDVEEWQTILAGNSAGSIAMLYVAYALDDYGIERPPVFAVIDNWGGFQWGGTPGDATLIDGPAATFFDPKLLTLYIEPRLFIAHGTADPIVSYSHTEDIVSRADEVGLSYVLHTEVGGGHGFSLFDEEFSPGVSVFQAQVNWLDSFLLGVEETPK